MDFDLGGIEPFDADVNGTATHGFGGVNLREGFPGSMPSSGTI